MSDHAELFAITFVVLVLVAFNHFVLVPMGYNVIDLVKELL
jgi:hypothetical protein